MPEQATARGTLTAIDIARFWAKFRRGAPDECWEWEAGRFQRSGYGLLTINRRPRAAHRISYEIHFGPIPDGLFVCHHCDNPPCVNPAHLWLGTAADNNHDRDRKGRTGRPLGDRNGSRTHPERQVRGITHPNAKLTPDVVREIRRRAAAGEPQKAIARDIGVSQSVISNVHSRKRWAHIE